MLIILLYLRVGRKVLLVISVVIFMVKPAKIQFRKLIIFRSANFCVLISFRCRVLLIVGIVLLQIYVAIELLVQLQYSDINCKREKPIVKAVDDGRMRTNVKLESQTEYRFSVILI